MMLMQDIITILLSFVAITIATLGYLDNRKNISIVLKKENEKKDIKEALEELKSISDLLKSLPDYICFPDLYYITTDIFRELYENDTLKLTIEFQTLDFLIPDLDKKAHDYYKIELNENTINTQSLRKTVKKLLISYRKSNHNIGGSNLLFITNPKIISNNFVESGEIFDGLVKIEDSIDKLNNLGLFIESFDADIIKTIDHYYEEILTSLADILQKKIYTVEFERNIKPSEIDAKINEIFNVDDISENTKYLSTDVASRIDELRKELTKQILTY